MCGKHALDDDFRRHALANDAAGIGRAYVLARGPDDDATLPPILGFYTSSAELVGCVGIIVDAKDEDAQTFYAKYDLVSLETEGWPRRMFIGLATVRAALAG